MAVFAIPRNEQKVRPAPASGRIACEAAVVAPCPLAACVCEGAGGMLVMAADKETLSFGNLRNHFAQGCLIARTRTSGMAILPGAAYRSPLRPGAREIQLTVTYKNIPVVDFIYPLYLRLSGQVLLLFYACPAICLDPNLFSATSCECSHLAGFANSFETLDAVGAPPRIVMVIQPPTLSPLESAITAMVPAGATSPTLLPMDDEWALGGALAHSAMRQQQAEWRLQDELGATAPMKEPNHSLLHIPADADLPHMHPESQRSMASLFKKYAATYKKIPVKFPEKLLTTEVNEAENSGRLTGSFRKSQERI
jgi:hypothetical protein